MASQAKISTCLWFDGDAEEAAALYVSLFKNSKVTGVMYREGKALTVDFELNGQSYTLLNAGPMFPQSESASIVAACDTQEEVDRLWSILTSNGGKESQCGWLKDKYGISWQIVPKAFLEMAYDKDPAKVDRVMSAMMQMIKLDIKTLRDAFEGRS